MRNPSTCKVTYQGCADAGLCYPPITKTLSIATSNHGGRTERDARWSGRTRLAGQPPTDYVSEQDSCGREDRERQPAAWCCCGFFGRTAAGLHALRAADGADPVGHHRGRRRKLSTRRAFLLSLAYVLGMACHVHRGGHRRVARSARASTCRPSSISRGSSSCSPAVRGAGGVDVRHVHHRDAELHPDAAQQRQQQAAGRHATSASA